MTASDSSAVSDGAGQISFTQENLSAFAELSGDYNPMHLDETYARRTMYGAVTVHGVAVVLSALRSLGPAAPRLAALKVRFMRPVFLHEELSLRVEGGADGWTTVEVVGEGDVKATLSADLSGDFDDRGGVLDDPPPRETAEAPGSINAGAAGEVEIVADLRRLKAIFPHLAGVPSRRLAVLLALTRIVGMKLPGEHSVFYEFEVAFSEPAAEPAPLLRWRVDAYDERFQLARMSVEADGVKGKIRAFKRPSPLDQPGMADVQRASASRVDAPGRALIVGGSRGLGELTAKIVAARGGEVVLTYKSGRADAERVVDEIRSVGKIAEAWALDLTGAGGDDLPRLMPSGRFDTLYYFASPPIFRGGRVFSERLFREFIDCYVISFERLVRALMTQSKTLAVFYPSSVAVDEFTPRMMEYSTAKAAGEELCRALSRTQPSLSLVVERLPRLPSDQTRTLSDIPFEADPLVLLNGIVDKLVAARVKMSP